MPEILMCLNHICPSRKECYRYRAIPSQPAQEVGKFEHEGDKCIHFLELGSSKNITKHGESGFDQVPGETGISAN